LSLNRSFLRRIANESLLRLPVVQNTFSTAC
jgi:hypothetical protein